MPPCGKLTIVHAHPQGALTEVKITDFVRWAKKMKWKLPSQLKKLDASDGFAKESATIEGKALSPDQTLQKKRKSKAQKEFLNKLSILLDKFVKLCNNAISIVWDILSVLPHRWDSLFHH